MCCFQPTRLDAVCYSTETNGTRAIVRSLIFFFFFLYPQQQKAHTYTEPRKMQQISCCIWNLNVKPHKADCCNCPLYLQKTIHPNYPAAVWAFIWTEFSSTEKKDRDSNLRYENKASQSDAFKTSVMLGGSQHYGQ